MDNVKEDYAAMNFTLVEASRVAEDRRFWNTSVHTTLGLPAREDSVIVAKALIKIKIVIEVMSKKVECRLTRPLCPGTAMLKCVYTYR